jgi:hypothetical protein
MPPHISYYIDDEKSEYDSREYAAYVKTVHGVETAVRTKNLPSEKQSGVAPIKTPAPYQTYKVNNGIITEYDGTASSIEIPEKINGETITGIGNKAFSGNEYLTDITLPETVTSIGISAFSECSSLKSISMKNVTEFGNHAFYKCSSLETAEITEGTQSLPSDIFSGCTSLKSVTIPRSISSEISLPSKEVTVYGYEASWAQKYYSDEFCVIEGMDAINENGWQVDPQGTLCGYTGDDAVLEIPTEIAGIKVNRIASLAFDKRNDIESVVIPEGVSRIDDGMRSLRSSSLSFGAFFNCTSLKSVKIPQSMKYIGTNTFNSCSSLESVELPENTDTIGAYAFYECKSLKTVVLPENISYAGDYLFYGCESLENAVIPDSLTKIPDYAFYGCTALNTAVLPDNAKSGGQYIFCNCTSLEKVNIPKGWTEIPDYAFYGCEKLKNMELSDNITSIGNAAFGKSGIESIDIPYSVLNIGIGAFYNCEHLTVVNLSKSIKMINSGSFYGCVSLEKIEIPDSVTQICAAQNRKGGGNISRPVGSYYDSFGDCTSLTKMIIPASVTLIEDTAFKGSDGLVIYGYTNSEAEKYAKNKEIEFVPIDTEEDIMPYSIADVKNDGDNIVVTLKSDENAPDAQVIVAFYDENGRPKGIFSKNIVNTLETYEFEKQGEFYKIFVWNLQRSIPYADIYSN